MFLSQEKRKKKGGKGEGAKRKKTTNQPATMF